jgi:hypothetical protein
MKKIYELKDLEHNDHHNGEPFSAVIGPALEGYRPWSSLLTLDKSEHEGKTCRIVAIDSFIHCRILYCRNIGKHNSDMRT